MAVLVAQPQRTERGRKAARGRLGEQRGGAFGVGCRTDAAVIAVGEVIAPRRVVLRQAGEAGEGLLGAARRPAQLAEIVDPQLQQRGVIAALGRGAQRAEPFLPLLRLLQQLRREKDDLLGALVALRACFTDLVHIAAPLLFFRCL